MRSSRRDFLSAMVSGAAALSTGCGRHLPPAGRNLPAGQTVPKMAGVSARSGSRAEPHYLVFILLQGGIDTLLTFNPQDQAVVGDGVDCGYLADERKRGRVRFYGPLIGELLRHESDIAILQGVRVDTVGHVDGEMVILAGKRNPGSQAQFLQRIGSHLPGNAPLESAALFPAQNRLGTDRPSFGSLALDSHTLSSVLDPQSEMLEAPPWFQTLGEQQMASAKEHFGPGGGAVLPRYVQDIRQSMVAQKWLANTPRTTLMRCPQLGPALHMALSGIRGNYAKSFLIKTATSWFDTHSDNMRLQRLRVEPAMNDLALFIDELKRERNAFGSLYDQTTIIMGSELGRYPKFNQIRGKDHWPECTWVMMGKGVRRGVTIGATSKTFQGVPVGYRSGAIDDPNRQPLYIDALFATATQLLIGNPKVAGYKEEEVLWAALEQRAS